MKLRYGPEDRPPHWESLLFGFQWTIIILSTNLFLLLLAAGALGLSPALTAPFVQRSLVFVGISCLLQLHLGHRLTVYDVVASFWLSTFVFVTISQQALGTPDGVILGKLQFLQLAAGILLVLATLSGIAGKIQRFFTPLVLGVTLVMIGVQIAAGILPGMMSLTGEVADPRMALFSVGLFFATFAIGLRGGRIQPYVGLLGLGGGWLLYAALGLPAMPPVSLPGIALPQLFAFGPPVADWSLLPIAFFIVLVYLSNTIATVQTGGDIMEVPITNATVRRTSYVGGITHLLTAVFASIVLVPAAGGPSLVAATGAGARRPMIWGAGFLILLGLVGPIGSVFAAIPAAVSYSVSLGIIARLMAMGLRYCATSGMGERPLGIAGFSILLGCGILFLPPGFFVSFGFLASILGNGLFVAVLAALLLENILLPEKATRA